jgi:hypothetical protein
MDQQTRHTLGRITRNIPAHLARNTTKTIVDTSEEEAARALLKDRRLGKADKERISRLIAKGAFRREEVVINDDVVKKIDAYHTREIEKARKAGKLGDPSKDKFIQERAARMRNR